MATDAMEDFHAMVNMTKVQAHAAMDTSGFNVAGNIPAVPAGPGGDQQQSNPFGTRTPATPFGKRNG